MYIPKDVTPAIRKRIAIEARIVKATVRSLLAAGYSLSVDDGGEEYAIKNSTSFKAIMDALLNTDEDRLIAAKDGKRLGWVFFVYGNDGWDVINDYSIGLEPELTAVNQLSDRLAEVR